MRLEDILELLIAGKLRIKIEWDKIPVSCPHCEWVREADTPTLAVMMLKAHLHICPNEPNKRKLFEALNDYSHD